MRLRLPELMENHRPEPIATAYRLSKASGGVISMTNAHHLVEKQGATQRVDMDTLVALCRVFKVGPEALFTEDPVPPASPKRKAKRKGATKKARR